MEGRPGSGRKCRRASRRGWWQRGRRIWMALLTDGNPNDNGALRVYESAILDVAHTETIDLEAKLALATDEIAEDVIDVLLDHSRQDPEATGRRALGVSDVVVTPQLRRWHAVHTLEIVYRDAF